MNVKLIYTRITHPENYVGKLVISGTRVRKVLQVEGPIIKLQGDRDIIITTAIYTICGYNPQGLDEDKFIEFDESQLALIKKLLLRDENGYIEGMSKDKRLLHNPWLTNCYLKDSKLFAYTPVSL